MKAFKRPFLLMYCECCSFSHQHSLRVASGGAQHPNNRLPDCRRATDRDANYDAMPIFVEACAHVASFDGLRGGDSGQRIERDPIRDRRFFNCARCLVGRRRRATNLLVISMVIRGVGFRQSPLPSSAGSATNTNCGSAVFLRCARVRAVIFRPPQPCRVAGLAPKNGLTL